MQSVDIETQLALFRLMAFSRALDRAIAVHDGHWHGCEGEEAVLAGVYHGLRPGDVLAPHYRGAPVAAYARGAELERLLGGLLGRGTDYFGGRQRSDICGPLQFNLIGLFTGSLGPPLGYTTGAALAMKLEGCDDAAVAVFGDGVSSRGDCHEAMNFAAVNTLPVVFVCQNNEFAISTPRSEAVAGSLVARGESFGIPACRVDGNDACVVHTAVQQGLARARAGRGPSFVEAATFRVSGHFYSDTCDYRDPALVQAWRQRDPLTALRRRLQDLSGIQSRVFDDLVVEVENEIDAALAVALAAAPPEASGLDENLVYAERQQ